MPVKKTETNTAKSVPDTTTYQANRRYMAWASLGVIMMTTAAVVVSPARYESAESVLMMLIGALSGVIASYFGFAHKR